MNTTANKQNSPWKVSIMPTSTADEVDEGKVSEQSLRNLLIDINSNVISFYSSSEKRKTT